MHGQRSQIHAKAKCESRKENRRWSKRFAPQPRGGGRHAIIYGIVIGSGIFVLPNLIARNLPSGVAILSAWVIAGALSFFGALAYAELGAMMPATGGQYVYLREAYGPMWAFVSGWTFMLAVLSGGSAWLAVTFSIYVRYFIPLSPALSKVLSLALIAALSAVNYVGVKRRRLGAAHFHLSQDWGAAGSDRGRLLKPAHRTRFVSVRRRFRLFGAFRCGDGGMPDGVQRLGLCKLRGRRSKGSPTKPAAFTGDRHGDRRGVVRAGQCGLPESAVGPTDRDDRTRRRGHGDRRPWARSVEGSYPPPCCSRSWAQ